MGFSLKKMFSWPKSKDPWTAMTKGSSFDFLKPYAKPAALIPGIGSILGTAIAGPGVGATIGAGLGALQGGTTGIWGKPGAGSALTGGIQGLGQSLIGIPIGQAGATGGFQTAANFFKNWGLPTIGSTGGQVGQGLLTSGGGAIPSTTQTGWNWSNIFNLGNLSKAVGLSNQQLLGAGLLGASALMRPPQLQQSGADRERAMSAIYSPDLVRARGMIRDLAMLNPSELVNPASDKYIEATLRQSRQAADRAKQDVINTYSARGKTIQGSGAVNERLARLDQEQLQREQDYITGVQEARYIAGINLKVNAVSQYFGVAQDEAIQLLQAYGYISPQDLINFQTASQGYNNLQTAMGQTGGYMLASDDELKKAQLAWYQKALNQPGMSLML